MIISNDKYITFFIQNYNDIKAINEIAEYAMSNLPPLIDIEMKNCISEIEGVHVDNDWWCDPELYDLDEEKGPYFGYEPQWNSLFSGNDPLYASYLFLDIDIGKLKQKSQKRDYIDRWATLLNHNIENFRAQGISLVRPVDYDDPYLLKYPLHREVNMGSLTDREKLKKLITKAVSNFTSTCLTILKHSDKKVTKPRRV